MKLTPKARRFLRQSTAQIKLRQWIDSAPYEEELTIELAEMALEAAIDVQADLMNDVGYVDAVMADLEKVIDNEFDEVGGGSEQEA